MEKLIGLSVVCEPYVVHQALELNQKLIYATPQNAPFVSVPWPFSKVELWAADSET